MSDEIKVRDIRNPGWFWVSNDVVRVYGPKIGAYGIAVYTSLAQCSFGGHCKTTMRQIATMLDISPQSAMRGVEKLIQYKLIRETKKSLSPSQGPSEYDLLPVPIGNGENESVPIGNPAVPIGNGAVPIGNGAVPIGNTYKTTKTYKTKEQNLPPSEDLFGKSQEPEGKTKKCTEPKEKTSDPRHTPAKLAIMLAYNGKNGVDYYWNGREGKKLSEFLALHPSWSTDTILRCVKNRFDSDENHAEEPHEWIARLARYASGALNIYGKPKENTPLSLQNGTGRKPHLLDGMPGPEELAAQRLKENARIPRMPDEKFL